MKTRNLFLRAMQICMVIALMGIFYSCNEDPVNPPEPPTEEPVPAGDDGDVNFSITNENTGSSTEGGSTGEGETPGEGSGSGTSPEDPAVAEVGESVDMTISQKSSYKDPDGSTYTCEPKATITMYADLDTVYAKDIETLTKVIGEPKVINGNNGSNPVNYTTDQVFNIGGQSVTFNLGYEVYTHKNSENQTIEMPYVKVNEANYGASTPTETKGVKSRGAEKSSVRLANITVTPAKKALSRSITVTDTTTYEVTARFNLDVESKNSSNDQKQTLSFEVKYYAVVVDVIEYEGAKLNYEVSSTISPSNGVYVVTSPEQPLEILVKQESSFSGPDGNTETGSATTKISAVAPGGVYFANKEGITEEQVKKLTAITVQEETLSGKLPYFDFSEVKFEGYEIASSNVCDTLETYHVIAKYSQEANPVNVETATQKPEKLTFAYQIEFIAKVKIELVDTRVRVEQDNDILWAAPHDNIPWRYHFIVYRDRIYSNGVTITDKFSTDYHMVEIETGPHYYNKPGLENFWGTESETEIDGYFDPSDTKNLYSRYSYIIELSCDLNDLVVKEGELRTYSIGIDEYKNADTGKTFADCKANESWYFAKPKYTGEVSLLYNGNILFGHTNGYWLYNYFFYLDGEKIMMPSVDENSYKQEFTLEDSYSEYRGNIKIARNKVSTEWLGKRCYVEVIDTICTAK